MNPGAQRRTAGATVVAVGLSQAALGSAGTELVSFGLGSCVGLVLWGPERRIGVLCHIMLPDSGGAAPERAHPAKYADWAVAWALAALGACGCRPRELCAKLAGGAQVLSLPVANEIGRRNADATLTALRAARLPVRGTHLGGGTGRTVRFDPGTGALLVRLAGGQEFTL